jgi:hypothetical protein
MHLRSVRLRPYLRDYGATLSPFWYDTRSRLAKAGPAALKPARNERAKAGEGNRTLVCSLGSYRSTIELHPRIYPRPRMSASSSLAERSDG